jgi:hypothetical protein
VRWVPSIKYAHARIMIDRFGAFSALVAIASLAVAAKTVPKGFVPVLWALFIPIWLCPAPQNLVHSVWPQTVNQSLESQAGLCEVIG